MTVRGIRSNDYRSSWLTLVFGLVSPGGRDGEVSCKARYGNDSVLFGYLKSFVASQQGVKIVEAFDKGVLEAMATFVDERLAPVETSFVRGEFDAVDKAIEAARQEVKERGWWAPHMPTQYGGMGLSWIDFTRVAELLGRTPVGHWAFNCQAPDAGNMELLAMHAGAEQKKRFLKPLVDGDIRSCFSMTEPGRPGSNPTWMETSARREGDEWVIDGRKWFTTAADGADFAIVMAVTEPEAPRHRQASMILVPTDAPGFEILRNISVMGETGSGYASHAEIAYRQCRVPARNLLGERGRGFEMAQQRLGPGRIHHCMRWLGICERAIELMARRAQKRKLTPTKRLGDEGVVRAWIADSRIEVDAARCYVLDTARKIERDGTSEHRAAVSGIKVFVAGVLQQVLDRAVQLFGAMGMTDATPLAYWYAHERGARIYDGPDEVHRRLIARSELKRHRQDHHDE